MEQRIIQQCLRSRRALPKKIENAPSLMMGLELYWDAFLDLSTCRPTGMGMGPIPWSAIRDYAVTFDFDEDQHEDLYHFIRVMDNAFIEHHRNKKE